MPDRDDLLAMGFEPERVEWALHSTNNSGLQSALDHLEANQDKPVPDYKSSSSATPAIAGADDYDEEDQAALMEMYKSKGQSAVDEAVAGGGAEAKSIKCTECGKVFKNQAFASFHAEKSGHASFEESTEEVKPLTEEEKKERLAQMRAKLAEKRAAQSKVDAEDAKANEKIRRKAGQDMTVVREDLKKKEALKDQQKKAAEKKADMEAKARVRAQIEADKRERAEKAAREKALREGKVDVATPAPSAASKPAAPAVSASTATEARLRIRAPGGQWMGTLPVETTLNQVESMIIDEGKATGPLKFSNAFPRKFFTPEEKQKSLKELGLVPNAALEANPL